MTLQGKFTVGCQLFVIKYDCVRDCVLCINSQTTQNEIHGLESTENVVLAKQTQQQLHQLWDSIVLNVR